MLTGIYTGGIEVIPFSSVTTAVRVPDPGAPTISTDPGYKPAQRSPVCVAQADVTASGGSASLKVELGTWDGAVFTATQTIGFVSAPDGETRSIWILRVIRRNEALRMTTTGSIVFGFVRTQGKTAVVP